MPTPFMHICAAHRFLNDPQVALSNREWLSQSGHLGAFILGNIAPDARVSGGVKRSASHFFEYAPQVSPHPFEAMLNQFPYLGQVTGNHRAFIAGYMAHLSMDVIWSEVMLFPHFYAREWGTQRERFNMLHVLLCYLDARDYQQWKPHYMPALQAATPHNWMPVLNDETLIEWRDIIAQQGLKDGNNKTLAILGKRVDIGEDGLRDYLDHDDKLQQDLWQHVAPTLVDQTETLMYHAMVTYVNKYLAHSA